MMVTLWMGVGLGDEDRDQGMAGLMEGGASLLIVADDHALAFDTHQDLVLGVFHVGHGHVVLVHSGRVEGRLVDQVGQVGAGETGSRAG